MTKDPNTLSDKELSAWLGGVLNSIEHDIDPYTSPAMTSLKNFKLCNTCHMWVSDIEEHCKPGPILLTPDNAFKWREWAVEKYGIETFLSAMDEIESQPLKTIALAQPRHYLIAAARCKLNQENDNGR